MTTVTNGPLTVTSQFDSSNLSAFGTLEVADMTPVIQGDFVYGLNTQLWSAGVVSGTGAAVDTNASRLRIQSGTNAAGYAYQTSRRLVRYRAGQGTTARFTMIFTAGAANNIQLFGKNDMTPDQERWAKWLIDNHHRVEVARSWQEAVTYTLEYLAGVMPL